MAFWYSAASNWKIWQQDLKVKELVSFDVFQSKMKEADSLQGVDVSVTDTDVVLLLGNIFCAWLPVVSTTSPMKNRCLMWDQLG